MKLIFALTGSIKGESEHREEKPRGRRRKEGAASSVPALKLTRAKEFRFLYNRFNLIPRASRPFRRGCERRKNIYFRAIRLSRVTACSFFFLFFLTRSFLHLTIRLFVIFFSSLDAHGRCSCVYNSEESIYIAESTTQHAIISIVKIVLSYFYNYDHAYGVFSRGNNLLLHSGRMSRDLYFEMSKSRSRILVDYLTRAALRGIFVLIKIYIFTERVY